MRFCSCYQPHVKAAVGTRTIAPAPTIAQTVVGQPTAGSLSLTRLPGGSHALVTKLPHGKNYITNIAVKRMGANDGLFGQSLNCPGAERMGHCIWDLCLYVGIISVPVQFPLIKSLQATKKPDAFVNLYDS